MTKISLDMWQLQRVLKQITTGAIYKKLDPELQKKLSVIPFHELANSVEALLQRPEPRKIKHIGTIFNVVHAAEYYDVFCALELPRNFKIYEPCVGSSDPVILAAEAFSDGQAGYAALNLNRPLRRELQKKIRHLKMSLRIIDDDVRQAFDYFEPQHFDVACFHHAINDILQTAVSEFRGMDTTTIDWWPHESQMIQWMAEDFATGQITVRGKPELLETIRQATHLVRPGGFLIFDHWASLAYGDREGFPWDLFCDLIPITRGWIEEAQLPLEEIDLPGDNPQWWMFLKVNST